MNLLDRDLKGCREPCKSFGDVSVDFLPKKKPVHVSYLYGYVFSLGSGHEESNKDLRNA